MDFEDFGGPPRIVREQFEIFERIGGGTFGEVNRAQNKETNKIVALKRIWKQKFDSKDEGIPSISAQREINALNDIHHENVIHLHKHIHDTFSQTTTLVFDYYPTDLRTILETLEAPLDEDQIKCIAHMLIQAVHATHQAGYIHRDIKPDNLLFDHLGNLKLSDFGQARRTLSVNSFQATDNTSFQHTLETQKSSFCSTESANDTTNHDCHLVSTSSTASMSSETKTDLQKLQSEQTKSRYIFNHSDIARGDRDAFNHSDSARSDRDTFIRPDIARSDRDTFIRPDIAKSDLDISSGSDIARSDRDISSGPDIPKSEAKTCVDPATTQSERHTFIRPDIARGVGHFSRRGVSNNYLTNEVGTRWYRAPELLYGAKLYSESIDIWSIGCIIAELFLRKPLFHGENDIDQIVRVAYILGTLNEQKWKDARKLPDFDKLEFSNMKPKSFSSILPNVSLLAIRFIEKLLVYDPDKRLSAQECLSDEWFHISPRPCISTHLPLPVRKARAFAMAIGLRDIIGVVTGIPLQRVSYTNESETQRRLRADAIQEVVKLINRLVDLPKCLRAELLGGDGETNFSPFGFFSINGFGWQSHIPVYRYTTSEAKHCHEIALRIRKGELCLSEKYQKRLETMIHPEQVSTIVSRLKTFPSDLEHENKNREQLQMSISEAIWKLYSFDATIDENSRTYIYETPAGWKRFPSDNLYQFHTSTS